MRSIQVRFEVRDEGDGWRLCAVPENRAGWAPIPLTRMGRGTPGGALVEFAAAMYALQERIEGLSDESPAPPDTWGKE